jgi:choline dehydrogenase-like flavoprotein
VHANGRTHRTLSTGGSVEITSTDPFTDPLIDPNFLTTQVDIETLREGVRDVIKFVSAPAWSNHVSGRYGDKFKAAVDDASIDAYVRSITTTIFHPASTAMMTRPSDSWGVVNPDFKVKGTSGLRIVDASVFVSRTVSQCIIWGSNLSSSTAIPA